MRSELVNIIFGMKVRQARIEADMTSSALASAAGISQSYLTEIEKGRKYPRADKILRIASALNIDYDSLVSIQLDPSMSYLKSALSSPILREFPFEEFDLDESHLMEMLTRAPAKASALLHAISEISHQYDLSDEHFLWAMLRSYQEIHDNYFPELEDAAEAFAETHGLLSQSPLSLDRLQQFIVDEFDYELELETLASDEDLRGYRSLFVQRTRPRLYVNSMLRPHQIKFLLAREIGYRYLDLEERSFTSSPDRVESFQQVLNDFKASYFAGSLIIPLKSILADMQELFEQEQWQPGLLSKMLDRYEITPEMLLYRFSEVAGRFFSLKLHFLRFHKVGDRLRVIKRLNMNRLPIPSGLALFEHHCRRWLPAKLLMDMEMQGGVDAFRNQSLIGVQMSQFLESGYRFLSLGFARPLVLAPQVTSSVVVGFREQKDLARTIRFVRDPVVPSVIINETCERCPLTAEECDVRAAEPSVLHQQRLKEVRQQAVKDLLGW